MQCKSALYVDVWYFICYFHFLQKIQNSFCKLKVLLVTQIKYLAVKISKNLSILFLCVKGHVIIWNCNGQQHLILKMDYTFGVLFYQWTAFFYKLWLDFYTKLYKYLFPWPGINVFYFVVVVFSAYCTDVFVISYFCVKLNIE